MSYTWNLPTKVLFGAGKVKELCNEKMPGKKALLVISSGKSVRENGADLEARTKVAFANTMGGCSMEVCSCVSQHAMEHALSGYHQELPHGAGLIMISRQYFTRWIEEHVCDERFVELAKAMGVAAAKEPMDFIAALKSLMAECGVDNLKMSDYGIRQEEFPQMARDAKSTMGVLFFCDRFELTDDDVVHIYQKSYR